MKLKEYKRGEPYEEIEYDEGLHVGRGYFGLPFFRYIKGHWFIQWGLMCEWIWYRKPGLLFTAFGPVSIAYSEIPFAPLRVMFPVEEEEADE